ncbi:4883_t:CDS:2 [Cetraspora pellucida]|uniref:4883_t:CDS:1 n=1 Tax=Cetraspora pellucida TaxID=1433469 RepID=A0A9N9AR39_9GLOM|nr:4883_t:CDS:2 [Cetraspora pellucida]
MVASEHIHIPLFALNNPLYTNVRGKILSFTLKKINDQYQKTKHAISREPLPPCTGFFSKTMRLPCAHTISLLENDQALMLHNIHEHWWILEHSPVLEVKENASRVQQATAHVTLDNMINTLPMILQNPREVSTRGRLSGIQHSSVNSTRRDPSGFELVECRE